MTTFGENLRELRVAAGLTQAQIAERIGVSNTYVSALESGRKPAPPHALVESLAACLDIEGETLWRLAREEREDRLRKRIDGTPTSLRVTRTPNRSEAPSVSPPENRSMDRLVRSVRGACSDQKSRRKVAEVLEIIARSLREEE